MNSKICSFVNSNFLDDAREIRQLGKGTYGSVYLVEKYNGGRYAVKYMNNYTEKEYLGVNRSSLIDIDALLRLQDVKEVINVIGICSDSDRIALILEAMDNDLYTFIQRTPLATRLFLVPKLFRIMIRTAALMETLNINHFDIKPQNILTRGQETHTEFKITDFGLAKASFGSNVVPVEELFTIWYRPPEFLVDRPRYSFRIFSGDIWSIGVTIIEFITGQPLFPGRDVSHMLQLIYQTNNSLETSLTNFINANFKGTITGGLPIMKILRTYIPQPQAEQLNSQIINMLSQMLLFNPNDRPSGIQLLDQLGERINPDFLSTLLPPPYSRRIHTEAADMILQVSAKLELSKAAILISLEIFTRYLDTLAIDLNFDNFIIIRALAVIRIAAIFTENRQYYTYNFTEVYREKCGMKCEIVSTVQIAQMEREVLHAISFRIYNLNLGPVIDRAYSKNINLSLVDPNQFVEPLEYWLINS